MVPSLVDSNIKGRGLIGTKFLPRGKIFVSKLNLILPFGLMRLSIHG
jgi:hypothetical protein